MGAFDWLLGSGRIPTAGQIGAYNPPTEWGVDVQTPFHTPITDILPGTVTQLYNSNWGQNVVIQTQYQGQTVNEYFQHLDTLASNLAVGAQVQAGQFLGLSGGETQAQAAAGMYPGAQSPNSSQYSSGPHTEFGFGAPWQGGGPNFNPTSLLQSVASGNTELQSNPSNSTGTGNGSSSSPWWCNPSGSLWAQYAPGCSNDQQMQQAQKQMSSADQLNQSVTGLINSLPTIGIFIGGGILILVGLLMLGRKPIIAISKDTAKGAEVAAA